MNQFWASPEKKKTWIADGWSVIHWFKDNYYPMDKYHRPLTLFIPLPLPSPLTQTQTLTLILNLNGTRMVSGGNNCPDTVLKIIHRRSVFNAFKMSTPPHSCLHDVSVLSLSQSA